MKPNPRLFIRLFLILCLLGGCTGASDSGPGAPINEKETEKGTGLPGYSIVDADVTVAVDSAAESPSVVVTGTAGGLVANSGGGAAFVAFYLVTDPSTILTSTTATFTTAPTVTVNANSDGSFQANIPIPSGAAAAQTQYVLFYADLLTNSAAAMNLLTVDRGTTSTSTSSSPSGNAFTLTANAAGVFPVSAFTIAVSGNNLSPTQPTNASTIAPPPTTACPPNCPTPTPNPPTLPTVPGKPDSTLFVTDTPPHNLSATEIMTRK